MTPVKRVLISLPSVPELGVTMAIVVPPLESVDAVVMRNADSEPSTAVEGKVLLACATAVRDSMAAAARVVRAGLNI